MDTYKIPPQTRIGHVHLKVSNLQKSLDFYSGLLGFDKQMVYGDQAAFISAGGYHHHIGLNTWHSKGAPHAPEYAPGLYHTAILYPERKDLAAILQRITEAKYPITGAIYLDDPDGNGVELYWDRPREQWPLDEKGNLTMFTKRLDFDSLMAELAEEKEG
jgi:catechol 2,3-dioxygenase